MAARAGTLRHLLRALPPRARQRQRASSGSGRTIQTADLHEERLRHVPDGQLFDVITNGLGLMSGYKYPIPPHDRWAIIAYVRQLQNEAGS